MSLTRVHSAYLRSSLLLIFLTISGILNAGDQYETAADLNIRRGPSPNYASISIAKKGEHLTVLDSTNSFWYKVLYMGDTGYAAKTYLIQLPDATTPTVPPSKGTT